MKKAIKYLFVIVLLEAVFTNTVNAQATQQKIGENPKIINNNAVLELQSSTKGLLLPRLELSATNNFAPLSSHVQGMTVYNTATNGTGTTAVTPGYYYNDGSKWVRIAANTDIKSQPWFRQGTSNEATLNTENIYQTGKVSIGGSNATGTLTVINASGATNTVDLAMRAALPSGNWATLNFISNLGSASFSSLSRAGDKGLIFSTDGNPNEYRRNGFLIAPHTAGGSSSPFGFKITEQGLSAINAPMPTETFDVNGTFRVRQLPVHGQENAIFTLPNGESSLPEIAEIGDIRKTQTFTATRTVVANDRGVLGYVTGLPGGVTADNGLTKTGDNIQLGGELEKDTPIILNGFDLAIDATDSDLIISGLDKTGVQVTDGGTINEHLLAVGADNKVKALKASMPKFFYMPSIIVPTSQEQLDAPGSGKLVGDVFDDATGQGTISLYGRYQTQFGTPAVSNGGANTTLPVLPATELDYHITWYDTNVFSSVSVTDAGVMTYTLVPGADVTVGSFMNIVFAVRENN